MNIKVNRKCTCRRPAASKGTQKRFLFVFSGIESGAGILGKQDLCGPPLYPPPACEASIRYASQTREVEKNVWMRCSRGYAPVGRSPLATVVAALRALEFCLAALGAPNVRQIRAEYSTENSRRNSLRKFTAILM